MIFSVYRGSFTMFNSS